MIKSFLHKGLEQFYRTGSTAGISAPHANRLRLILSNLDQAEKSADMDLPGLALHPLKGDRKGTWAVKVSGNWRLTFRFSDRQPELVNYEDYH
ncbi:MAG: type II toxin-antitoxin system RelE/ParE family toxin [Candidatus Contendobacter sp.]